MSKKDPLEALVERTLLRGVNGLKVALDEPAVVGACEKTLIHAQGTLRLYHFQPTEREVYRVPLLMVMAPTNRGYIFDLAKNHSMVEFLLGEGFDVYLIDWDAPSAQERTAFVE